MVSLCSVSRMRSSQVASQLTLPPPTDHCVKVTFPSGSSLVTLICWCPSIFISFFPTFLFSLAHNTVSPILCHTYSWGLWWICPAECKVPEGRNEYHNCILWTVPAHCRYSIDIFEWIIPRYLRFKLAYEKSIVWPCNPVSLWWATKLVIQAG